jgi:hypothetical protein
MHKVSASFKNVSSSEPNTKGSAKRLLMKLLTKDADGNYPWQYPFEHDSFPDRVWGPYKDFPSYLLNIDVNGEQKPPGPWSSMTVEDYRDWFAKDAEVTRLIGVAMGDEEAQRQQGIVDDAETKTQAQIAKERGISQQRVSAITTGTRSKDTRKARVNLSPGTDPAKAAERIRAKLGEEFAQTLKEFL